MERTSSNESTNSALQEGFQKACRSLIVERCTPSKKEFGLSFNGGSPGPYPVLELLGIKSLP